ncbi:MAG: hypothetical protein FJX71_04775 [Alphaproteobacteria bacterium]|nr:hypothetical protein [Alphaproteobacteria bacterium]
MLILIKLILTFFIFSTHYLPCYAAEAQSLLVNEDDEGDKYRKFRRQHTALPSSQVEAGESSPLLGGIENPLPRSDSGSKKDELEVYLKPVVQVPTSQTCKQITSGTASAFAGLFAAQTGIPLGSVSLGEIGITTAVIPDTGAPEVALITALAVPAATVALVHTYNRIADKMTPEPEETKRVKRIVTDPAPRSKFERWLHSTPSTILCLGIMASQFFTSIFFMESGITFLSDYATVFGVTFGLLFSLVVYEVFIAPTNNPNNNPNKNYFRKKIEKIHEEELTEVITHAQAVIMSGKKPQEIQTLGEVMNAIYAPLSPDDDSLGAHLESEGAREDERRNADRGADKQDDADDIRPIPRAPVVSEASMRDVRLPPEPKYVQAFKAIIEVAKSTPGYIKVWDKAASTFGKWTGNLLQIYALTNRYVAISSLTTLALVALKTPETVAFGAGIVVAAVATPALIGFSYRMTALACPVYERVFKIFQPTVSAGQWGGRIPGFLSPTFSAVYFPIAYEVFVRNKLYLQTSNITNTPMQLALVMGEVLGTIFPAGIYFFSPPLERITNWVQTGAEINVLCCHFKLLPCVDRSGRRRQRLIMYNKLQTLKQLVRNLKPEYREFLHSQLRRHLPEKDYAASDIYSENE